MPAKELTVVTIRIIMRTPWGIALTFPLAFRARKKRAHRATSWIYIPTSRCVMALGKKLPPVSLGASMLGMPRHAKMETHEDGG